MAWQAGSLVEQGEPLRVMAVRSAMRHGPSGRSHGADTEPEDARPSAQVERVPARTSATACQSSRTRSTRSGDSASTASRNSPANAFR